MSAQHTSHPWQPVPGEWHVGAGNAKSVFIPGLVKPINAGTPERGRRIVQCVNAHDELLAALVKIVKYADSEPDGGDMVEMHRANVERARAAIAKATGSAA